MVNRVWLHLFGRGLVPTPDNFGASGQPPSHPGLLDHLAVTFMENGWSVKKLIRAIVLSRAYQLRSQFDAKNNEADPDNVLVWRMPQAPAGSRGAARRHAGGQRPARPDAAQGQSGRAATAKATSSFRFRGGRRRHATDTASHRLPADRPRQRAGDR